MKTKSITKSLRSIQRYDISSTEYIRCPDGAWVRWESIHPIINLLEGEEMDDPVCTRHIPTDQLTELKSLREIVNFLRMQLAEGCTISADLDNGPLLELCSDGTWSGGLYIQGKQDDSDKC